MRGGRRIVVEDERFQMWVMEAMELEDRIEKAGGGETIEPVAVSGSAEVDPRSARHAEKGRPFMQSRVKNVCIRAFSAKIRPGRDR